MKILGITGNSGGGKTTVCKILEGMGAYIINADAVARKVVEPGEAALAELVDHFGEGILTKGSALNRKALAEIAFANESQRQKLIDITHKYIIRRMNDEMEAVAASPGGYRFIVLDAPLLVEANMHLVCDQVWLVTASRENMLRRIVDRDGLTTGAAEARLASQPESEALKPYADTVIINDGGLEDLERCVEGLVNGFF